MDQIQGMIRIKASANHIKSSIVEAQEDDATQVLFMIDQNLIFMGVLRTQRVLNGTLVVVHLISV